MPRRPRRKRRPRKRARRGGRWRIIAAVALSALVLALGCLVYLHVTLTQRFDGRLWMLPSRVYSDVLRLAPGDVYTPEELSGRLDRSGYGATEAPPTRPGQYRRVGREVEVYLRPFEAAGVEGEARRLRFDDERLRSIRDGDGRSGDAVVLEPELLATLFGPRQEERQVVPLAEVPETLVRAVLAAEDQRFRSHHGLDPRGILRAAWANLRQGRIAQGGSTITQQTVKNLYLGQERTWWRKSREGLMSVMLDARYSKRRILEVYLNEVYLGQRGPVAVCGVQAASRYYFGRDVAHLSLSDSALLAGLIRSPGRYNPFAHPERARGRREEVLDAMLRLGWAELLDIEAARDAPLSLGGGGGGYAGAAYAVDFVQAQLVSHYPRRVLNKDGLRIDTTLDTRWQQRAERALATGLERIEATVPTVRRQMGRRRLQGAVLVTDPIQGSILALVGGRDHGESQFNRVVQARRQPGSCFKPFVFAAGFELARHGDPAGLTPSTLLDDSPLVMRAGGRDWSPENYDRQFRGPVTVRRALEESLNVPTVRAANRVGLERVIDSARRCGIDSPLIAVPSLALGAIEVTPLELATAYSTLARQGIHRPPWIIREVTDRNGRPLARVRVSGTRAISPESAHLVNDVLTGVLVRGTARSAATGRTVGRAAGKTGTTDDTRDAWFVGYTPELLTLAWVGYDDNARTGLTGATGALPIWADVMRFSETISRFETPAGLVQRSIDPETGGLATKRCPTTVVEQFPAGTEPTQPCLLHKGRFRRWFNKLLRRGPPPGDD